MKSTERATFEKAMKGEADFRWNEAPGQYAAPIPEIMWKTWQAARSQQDTACLSLLTDIRWACGDNGKRMQDELVDHIVDINKKAQAWDEYQGGALQSDTCKWTDDGDAWEGECGVYWYLEEGSPDDNGVNFCPRCGKHRVSNGGSTDGE